MSFYRDYEYVSAAQKTKNREKFIKELSKKRTVYPVSSSTRAIASSWWGKSWIKNLEGYADYTSRLARGRTYARNGSILDLQIETGTISALVAGSNPKPYEIAITISPLKPRTKTKLIEACRKEITGLSILLAGEFPPELEKIFLSRGDGLFPSPAEINFECTCPDWADMCKHVAAVLYGTAIRLDSSPDLFFKLRGLNVEDFADKVAQSEKSDFIKKAAKKTSRVISGKDVAELFGF